MGYCCLIFNILKTKAQETSSSFHSYHNTQVFNHAQSMHKFEALCTRAPSVKFQAKLTWDILFSCFAVKSYRKCKMFFVAEKMPIFPSVI